MSEDPIGVNGGLILYMYVGDNPINAVDSFGLDALILVGRNQSNPTYFTNIANASAEAYERQHPGQQAHVVQVRNVSDVQNALRGTGNIDRLDYTGHAGQGVLYLSDQSLGLSDVAGLDTSNVNAGAQINLVGCNTATGGNNSLAQAFANHFDAITAGVVGGLSFGFPIRLGTSEHNINLGTVMPWFPRGRVDVRQPGQVHGANPIPTSPFGVPRY